MKLSIKIIISGVLCFLALSPATLAVDFPWAFAFHSGPSTPTEEFNNRLEDDYFYSLSFEYMNYSYLGVRVFYGTREFDVSNRYGRGDVEIDTFSVDAIVAYEFPRFFRVFALAGPTYFYSKGQESIGLGSDSKDIGWNAGLGVEYFPIPRWGVQLQSNYNNAQLGTGNPRSTWVDTSLGLTFRF